MALIDDVKVICDRLGGKGWRDLLLAVSGGKLDIVQASAAALEGALSVPQANIDRSFPGFEDFSSGGKKGITPGIPSESLLYHVLASPRVLRDNAGALLGAFPTIPEIETVENYVFAARKSSLADLKTAAGSSKLSIVAFAAEYRPADDTPDMTHAELTFSRTGIARIGTSRPKYDEKVRGHWPEDVDNPHAFRVIPVRFSLWLAAPVKGKNARVMRLEDPDPAEQNRNFWIPVHKLFEGKECLQGLDLTLQVSAKFFNMKLQKVMQSVGAQPLPTSAPYVIESGLAELVEESEHGRFAVLPVVQESLVEPAKVAGKFQTYPVPKNMKSGFATYETRATQRNGMEIHPVPAYVHARTKVKNGVLIDLNEEEDVAKAVNTGGYDALLYVDFTGEGWVKGVVPQLSGRKEVETDSKPAYILLSAPDFFASTGQREVSRWTTSKEIPKPFRDDQLWGVPPIPLCDIRLPANVQLPQSPFQLDEDTITAVVAMQGASTAPLPVRHSDIKRSSTLPDDGAGVFAPGWDVSADVQGKPSSGPIHLAGYGLGSPFPEDAKLCAALSTFWPSVAPDVFRTMSVHTGNANLRGTVAPLTDEEIGQIGNLPWDGVPGPKVIDLNGQPGVEMASFLHVDYVTNMVENRFSPRLLSRITAEEYEARVLTAARVHWILSGGANVTPTRTEWLLLSFRAVSSGDPELEKAQAQAGHILHGDVYRVEACFIGAGDPTVPSSKGPRFRILPLRQLNQFFVSASGARALRRRETDNAWSDVAAE